MSILLKNVNPTILGTVDTTIEVVNNITIGGFVGIGVAAPASALEIAKSGGANIKIQNTSGGKSALFGLDALGPFVKVSANDNTFQVRNLSDTAIFTVDHTNSRIGINITTPAAPLDVRGTGGIAVGASTSGRWLAKTSSSAATPNFSSDARFSIERFTNETASDSNIKFSVQSDGYVAIGAGGSAARSHLDLAVDGSVLTIGGGGAGGYLRFGANSIDNSIEYANNHLGYRTTQGLGHRFFSAGVERLRIGSSAINPAVPQNSRVSIYGRLSLIGTDGAYTAGVWFKNAEADSFEQQSAFIGRTSNISGSSLGFYHSGVWAFELNSSAVVANVPFVANKRIYVSGTASVDSSTTGQGLFFDTTNATTYGIYKAPGAWGPTSYPSLRIAFNSGIRMGASFQYGGIQFFSDSGMGNRIASFGEGDTKFRAYGGSDLYAAIGTGVSILTASVLGFGSSTTFSIRSLTSSLTSAPASVRRGDARPEMQMQSQSGTKMLHFLPPSDTVASPAQITSVRDDLALCVVHPADITSTLYEKMRISHNAITFGQNANSQSEILKIMTDNSIPSPVGTNYIRGNNGHLVINANGALYLNPDGGNTGDVYIRDRLKVFGPCTHNEQLMRIGGTWRNASGFASRITIGHAYDAWATTDYANISTNERADFCFGNNLRMSSSLINQLVCQSSDPFSNGSAIVLGGAFHPQGTGCILFFTGGSTAGAHTASSAAKMIMDNTGRLGIGGVSPADKLDVISASGDNGIRITNTLNSANDTCVLRFIQASTQRAAIFTNQGTLYFSTTAGSSRLRIESTGNVGIGMGSTAATQPLQVNGVIYSSSGGFKFPDSTTQTTAATGGVAYGSATVLTASGTFTVPAGVTKIKVTVTGGGAGGAFVYNGTSTSQVGGGAGGTGIKWLAVSATQQYTVVVGAGGPGASSPYGLPAPGGASSFVNLALGVSISASGGAYASGGAVTGADLNLKGGDASKVLYGLINGVLINDQIRGNSYWNQSYGSGGLAGIQTVGGAGVNGVVVIEY